MTGNPVIFKPVIGAYIHIPFCKKKCSYCDFYSITDISAAEKYTTALIKEIRNFYNENGEIKADTVYFGGGTPSCIPDEFIRKILSEIKTAENAEITIELNPKTFNSLQLKRYKEYGINRISMGLQSANDNELEILGRIHTFSEFLISYELLRNTGFNNINTDIMYGLPYSDEKTLKSTLNEILKLDCEHISAYALTLSENTPIYKGNHTYPTDDEVFLQYEMVNEALKAYDHYEISNYAKIPSRHNLKYWTNMPYVGFGAGAHSYFNDKRWENSFDMKEIAKENVQNITADDRYSEYIMLSLRLKNGINLEYIKTEFNIDFLEENKEKIKKNIEHGYMNFENNRISLTEKGFFISNSIILSFLC